MRAAWLPRAPPRAAARTGLRPRSKNWGPGSGMPLFGILPVTVPGAVWGWQEILRRFGTRGFKDVLEPAIRYARDGVPISERIASDWLLPDVAAVGRKPSGPDPDSVRAWYVAGKPPAAGTLFRNPGPGAYLRITPATRRGRLLSGRSGARDYRQVHRTGGHHDECGPRLLSGRMARTRAHALPRLRRVRAAAAVAGLGHTGNAQHSAGLRAAVGRRTDSGHTRTPLARVLASVGGSQEARVRRSV